VNFVRTLCCLVATLASGACVEAPVPSATVDDVGATLVRSIGAAQADVVEISSAIQVDSLSIVADATSAMIAALLPNGRLSWRAGGKGRGPGEMLRIDWMSTSYDTLRLFDGRQRKLVFRSLSTGALLSERRIDVLPLYARSSVDGVLSDHSLLLSGYDNGYDTLIGVVRPERILLVSKEGSATEIVSSVRGSELLRARSGTAATEMLRPLGKRAAVAAVGGEIFVFDGDTLGYFARTGPGGWRKTVVDLPLVLPPHAPTAAERRWASLHLTASGAGIGYFQAMLASTPAPTQSPLWGSGDDSRDSPLVIGSDGTLCLRAFTDPTVATQRWWLRGPQGGAWRSFTLPARTKLLAVHGSTILAKQESDSIPDVLQIRVVSK